MKKILCFIALLFPVLTFAQWNQTGDNSTSGSVNIGGSFITGATYSMLVQSAGDAVLKKTTPGNFVICSYLGTPSDVRVNYGYGGGTGGLSVFDGGSERNANFKVTSNGHLIISPSGYQGNLGNVAIGTTDASNARLTVAGTIRAKEVRVTINIGPDFVFKDGYDLKNLSEVEAFIKEKGHLPDVAPATEMEQDGVELGKMDMKLLQKVEELTLYLIEQNKKIKALEIKVAELSK